MFFDIFFYCPPLRFKKTVSPLSATAFGLIGNAADAIIYPAQATKGFVTGKFGVFRKNQHGDKNTNNKIKAQNAPRWTLNIPPKHKTGN
ncbi:hypothetical protein KDM87_13995 [Undibacterium sp. FT147W]|uniref:Uncharacterized protein n=1 Tax=Undibacterium rivi TaxID=2828729 RepID=A0ABS5H483_9BURK|nr:hypothetical protein [Undibacterium rivi]MBR7793706.1 hypothetical protein [Undibacterium rivi]